MLKLIIFPRNQLLKLDLMLNQNLLSSASKQMYVLKKVILYIFSPFEHQ